MPFRLSREGASPYTKRGAADGSVHPKAVLLLSKRTAEVGGSEARLRRFAPLQGLGVRWLSKRRRSKTGGGVALKPLGLVADGQGSYSRGRP